MRTYLTPIGYDTRRVTRPVVHNGIAAGDAVLLLRPADESNTERAQQAIADVRHLLREIEESAELSVEHVPTESLDQTILTCSDLIRGAAGDRIISLGGGARDLLLPLLLAALVRYDRIDQVLFFSDLDHSVEEWNLPNLLACPPERTVPTLQALAEADSPASLSTLATASDRSKSTIVRHVKELEELGLVRTFEKGQAKYVEITLAGRLLSETDSRR